LASMSGAAIAIHLFAIVGAVWLAFREAGRLRERGFKSQASHRGMSLA